MKQRIVLRAALLGAVVALSACAPVSREMIDVMRAAARVDMVTPEGRALAALPEAAQPLSIAVYRFTDMTGQRKPKENVAELSTAVTQGAHTMVMDAALRAGGGTWFRIVERGGLENLLQERQIIRQQRAAYQGINGNGNLPALLFAGALLEGGIVSYDTNVMTGGIGARLLGIGAFTEYRADQVEVSIRLTSVQTGEVLSAVNANKTVFSTQVQGNVFKYISFDEILEGDAGFTVNEPTSVAVRAAVDAAVHRLIVDGVEKGFLAFKDPEAGQAAIADYYANRSYLAAAAQTPPPAEAP